MHWASGFCCANISIQLGGQYLNSDDELSAIGADPHAWSINWMLVQGFGVAF